MLERGRLVEQGTHDELMARQRLYFYLASHLLELLSSKKIASASIAWPRCGRP